jgi:thiamine-phosphate pyrophosphorylase
MIAYAITNSPTLDFKTKIADMVVYRDKLTSNYNDNAKLFLLKSKKLSFDKILLHSNVTLAYKLKADGIHLTSGQFDEIKYAKDLGLFVVISTHTKKEATKAEELGADMITFSPIFTTPNKGEPKGVERLKELVLELSIPVLALGGILTSKQIELCKDSGAEGFASIRYFLR